MHNGTLRSSTAHLGRRRSQPRRVVASKQRRNVSVSRDQPIESHICINGHDLNMLVVQRCHVTYLLETRSKYSTKIWHISVTGGDIREIQKATYIKLMQKLLRSSKLSCSKPFITLLKQQISNCCTVKKSHAQCALLSDCYPHQSSVVVCTLCISNA